MTATDVFLLHTPIHATGGVCELWAGLSAGAAVLLAPVEGKGAGLKLAGLASRRQQQSIAVGNSAGAGAVADVAQQGSTHSIADLVTRWVCLLSTANILSQSCSVTLHSSLQGLHS